MLCDDFRPLTKNRIDLLCIVLLWRSSDPDKSGPQNDGRSFRRRWWEVTDERAESVPGNLFWVLDSQNFVKVPVLVN